MPRTITLPRTLTEKCHYCGIALKKVEIECEIAGQFVDYGDRVWGDINLTLCSGCWGRIKEILGRDQGDAILKRKEIENGGPDIPKPQLDFSGAEEELLNDNPDAFKTPDSAGVGI